MECTSNVALSAEAYVMNFTEDDLVFFLAPLGDKGSQIILIEKGLM